MLQLPQAENAHLQATSYHLLKRMIAPLRSNSLTEHTHTKKITIIILGVNTSQAPNPWSKACEREKVKEIRGEQQVMSSSMKREEEMRSDKPVPSHPAVWRTERGAAQRTEEEMHMSKRLMGEEWEVWGEQRGVSKEQKEYK